MRMKKTMAAAMAVAVMMTSTPVSAASMNVKKPSQSQIKAFVKKSGAKKTDKTTYSKKPKYTKPYSEGTLSSGSLKSSLAMLNQIRYIAGIGSSVKLDSAYTKQVQTASLINDVNGQLSHTPKKPSGMSDAMYKLGYQGASSSNIAMGYKSLNAALIEGWLEDSDSYNISVLGHRRWILNPAMGKTGFGFTSRTSYPYSAMYSFDFSDNATYTNVAWPAQNTPTDYFVKDSAWSLSTGNIEDISKVKVSVVRSSDKKKWNFSKKSSNGYFNVDNDGYGLEGCIIFRPKSLGTVKSGQKYAVTITGLAEGTLKYNVEFFNLTSVAKPKTTSISKLKPAKKKMQVTWKKVSGASGYQVRYSLKKSMTSSKTVKVSSKYTKKTISKLKGKKRYYFQVRAYKKSGSTTAYGSWSAAKSATTKK